MPTVDADLPFDGPAERTGALRRLAIAVAAGVVAGGATIGAGPWRLAPVATWDATALCWVIGTWLKVWPLDAQSTAAVATSEDPGWRISDALLGSACVVSLVAVGFVLVQAGRAQGAMKGVLIGVGVASVVLSWTAVHTIFTLRYADLYYADADGGVSFNQDAKPCYADFAYLAFTLGMTFQVSDTDLRSTNIRRQALKHALLSYVFGTVIVATSINLVSGLSR